MSAERVFTVFHESFALSLPSMSAILKLSFQTDGHIALGTIRSETQLGANYVKAMPRYARGCGLLEMGSYKLTPFGEAVCRHDPNLTHPGTLWLMHYHLSAPHGPGPSFWSHLVTACLPFDEEIDSSEITSRLASFLASQPAARPLQKRSVHSTATIFLGTYTKSDGLGRLELLATGSDKGPKKCIRVSEPQSPPVAAVAYALADYWEAACHGQATVNLNELARDDGFARIMWMDRSRLEDTLESLRRAGIVDLYRLAPPYQVTRLWSNKADLLNRLYE